MDRSFLKQLFQSHQSSRDMPSPAMVCNVIDGLLELLFPELADRNYSNYRDFEQHFSRVQLELYTILTKLEESLAGAAEEVEQDFLDRLPEVHRLLLLDAEAILSGDPAALSIREVIRTYPGFYAIAVYRLAHELYQLRRRRGRSCQISSRTR